MFYRDWRFWLGVAFSLGFLGLLAFQVDPAEIKGSLARANYVYLAPAIVIYFVGLYFRSFRWRYLLSPIQSFPVSRLYPVVVIGYMANNLLPARLGELVRAYYLARREECSSGTALATIAVERVYDGMTLMAFCALSAPLLLLMGAFSGQAGLSRGTAIVLSIAVAGVFAAALVVLTLLARQGSSQKIVELGLRFVPGSKAKARVRGLLTGFILGLAILNSPGKHLIVFLLSLPVWAMEGSMYLLVGYSFGLHDYFPSFGAFLLVAMLVTATSNLATAMPTAVGGIGPFELVTQQTLVVLGVGASLAGAYGAFIHLVALWLPVNLAGLALLWTQNLSITQLARRPVEQAEQNEAPLSQGWSPTGPSGNLPQAGSGPG